ncbi:NAD(P)-binding domain-containing protein [uncultured Jatrophihabitans sp.]|uniref:NAD(P)-binding domain-containing protein n=1 Tax=uncultured Jatrophihabitans sp. TaxID=1610747 RepID=UPI0035CB7A2C
MLTVAVLGLGEAGGAIAADLIAAGVTVRGYDPQPSAQSGAPAALVPCPGEAEATRGADVVLSVNSAAAAMDALRAGFVNARPSSVWADLNTASPQRERELAGVARSAGVPFADVSLMAPVPGNGLRTPMLVSGDGAPRYAELFRPLGADIEVLELPAGEAAQRKLLRSVFFKGTAAAVTEALHAAQAVGMQQWMRELIGAEFERADASFAQRLERGSVQHAVRRQEEMAAAVELLDELGVPPRIAAAARDWLADLAAGTE